MRCFLLGADLATDVWLVAALRSRHCRVVEIPYCDLLKIHLEAGGASELLLHGMPLNPGDRLFFLRMPQLPLQIDVTQRDFAYSEWRAALEAALFARSAQVLNGEWVLNNFALRGSNTFWTRMCQKICSTGDTSGFAWPAESAGNDLASFAGLEVTLTRRRWVGEHPLLYEIERHEASLLKLQQLLRRYRLDFLRVWLDPSSGPIRIIQASAELPTESSHIFEEALDDFL